MRITILRVGFQVTEATGDDAFRGCAALTSVDNLASVESIREETLVTKEKYVTRKNEVYRHHRVRNTR